MGFQQSYHTGRKPTGCSFYRHMRTTQERRLWDPEYGRAKRSRQRLVEAYDERIRRDQRTWKAFRKTRWKP